MITAPRLGIPLVLIAAVAGQARAGLTLDQSFEPPPTATFDGDVSSSTVAEFVDHAQTFTVGIAGQLDRVDVLVRRQQTNADLFLDLRPTVSGFPTANDGDAVVLATILAADVPAGADPVWITVQLEGAGPVVAVGEVMALVLRTRTVPPEEQLYQWRGDTGDPYAGGGAFARSSAAGGAWFRTCEAGDCTPPEAHVDWGFRTWVQPAPEGVTLELDIKPGSCPNPFNRSSNGVLPVGLLGIPGFPADQVDITTLAIARADGVGGSAAPNEGPPGPHTVVSDVGTPFGGAPCDCHPPGGDGIPDLSMKFKTQNVVNALQLDDLPDGAQVELVVSGTLLDGTPFSASDCVTFVPPGSPPGMLAVQASSANGWVGVSPDDLQVDGGGFGSFQRTYAPGTVVMLSTSDAHLGGPFLGWEIDGKLLRTSQTTLPLVITGQTIVVGAVAATRESGGPLDPFAPGGGSQSGADQLGP